MTLLLWGANALLVTILAAFLVRDPRRAILAGLIFCAAATEALPDRLIPISGFSVAVLVAFVALAGVWRLAHGPRGPAIPRSAYVYLGAVGLFTLWLLAGVLLEGGSRYSALKAEVFVLRVILPLVALQALAPFDRKDLVAIFWSLMAAAGMCSLDVYAFGAGAVALDDGGRVIAVSRVMAQGAALAAVMVAFNAFHRPHVALLFLPVLGGLAAFVVVNGERGPLVAIVGALLGVFCFTAQRWRGRLSALLSAGAVAAAVQAVLRGGIDVSAYPGAVRVIKNLGDLGSNSSDTARIDRIAVAWQGFLDTQGLGVGTGGFAALYGTAFRDYPHNIVLEVAVEAGLVGLVLLAVVLGLALYRTARASRALPPEGTACAVLGLWFYALLNAMVSGDIVGNAGLWITGGLACMVAGEAREAAPAPEPVEGATHEARLCQSH